MLLPLDTTILALRVNPEEKPSTYLLTLGAVGVAVNVTHFCLHKCFHSPVSNDLAPDPPTPQNYGNAQCL